MSNNVIEFPKKEFEFYAENMSEYLRLCKIVLTEEDYVDVLCSIMDKEIYDAAEQDIKNIVDRYYAYNF